MLSGAELGPHILEAGPGPGLTTDRLRCAVARLTAIEADDHLAERLRDRLRNTNVEVVHGDATIMPFPDAEFSGCAAFTMLHHVSSPALQDKLLPRSVAGYEAGRGVCGMRQPAKRNDAGASCGGHVCTHSSGHFWRTP